MKRLLIVFLLLPAFAFCQSSKRDSIWLPFQYFAGSWKGTGTGEPGAGSYERTYNFIFNKQFIEVRNKAVYPPKKTGEGEIHQDIGYISYDKKRKTFVLRQFHKEGFVNQYVLDHIASDGKKIVFITESIENIPAGFKARETYEISNAKEFTETFELAEPGKEFQVYTRVSFKKD